MITPHCIINEARSWLGTAFHHQGRAKKNAIEPGGCDCIGLILGVAKTLKLHSRYCAVPPYPSLLSEFDQRHYSRMPDHNKLLLALEQHCIYQPLTAIKPADILVFSFENRIQHVGLLAGEDECFPFLTLIHAYLPAKRVIEHRYDEAWQQRTVAAYRFADL